MVNLSDNLTVIHLLHVYGECFRFMLMIFVTFFYHIYVVCIMKLCLEVKLLVSAGGGCETAVTA